jgi:hypothetical protein
VKDVDIPDFLMMRAMGSEMPLQYGMEMWPKCLRFSVGLPVAVGVVSDGSAPVGVVVVDVPLGCAFGEVIVVPRSRYLPLLYVSCV